MTDDNLVHWNGITRLDSDVGQVIDRALEAGLKNVTIIGYDNEGAEYFASSYADGAQVVWDLERAKFKLMNIVESMSA